MIHPWLMRILLESLNLNTMVVTIPSASKNGAEAQEHEALDEISDAIAVATANLGLMPGVSFQARVAQLAHLSTAHKAVSVPTECHTDFLSGVQYVSEMCSRRESIHINP